MKSLLYLSIIFILGKDVDVLGSLQHLAHQNRTITYTLIIL